MTQLEKVYKENIWRILKGFEMRRFKDTKKLDLTHKNIETLL